MLFRSQKRKFYSRMVFRPHKLPSNISFFGLWVPSELPKKENLFQGSFWFTVDNASKMNFGPCGWPSKFPFLECGSHQNSPKKEIPFQNSFWIVFTAIKNFLFQVVGPINFLLLVILMGPTFLKRQFCFSRAKKFSSKNFLFWKIYPTVGPMAVYLSYQNFLF